MGVLLNILIKKFIQDNLIQGFLERLPMINLTKKDMLQRLIKEKSFKQGSFTLSSGKPSSYFFDLKPVLLDPKGIELIGSIFYNGIRRCKINYVGGIATGGIPIITSICIASCVSLPRIYGFYIRKTIKDHGTATLIEGNFPESGSVLLFEDVVTTGHSILNAVNTIRKRGCYVNKAFTIIDRLEGGKDNLMSYGIDLVSIFTLNDFIPQPERT